MYIQHETLINERQPEIGGLAHTFGRLMFHLLGWRVTGVIPTIPKAVVVVGPHTTNFDGILLMLTRWVVRVELDWMVKIEWTRGPIGWLIRSLGGVGIDRSASFNAVEQAVNQFHQRDRWVLAIAPEGTRRKTDHWKTGFYWIAHGAGVPIVCGRVDYARRVVDVSPTLITTTGDLDADMALIFAQYEGVTARHPERISDRRVRPNQNDPVRRKPEDLSDHGATMS